MASDELRAHPVTAAPAGFRIFAATWCVGVLVHQLYQGRFVSLDATAPLTFAALFALMRPASLPRFAALIAIHLATVVYELPRVVNHWWLMGATCLGLLLALVPALRRDPADRAKALELCLGPVRAQLVLVYAWAAFHKLNSAFLDPSTSCGAEHYAQLAEALPLLPRADWALQAAVAGSLAIEIALPLLLAFPRGRPAAFALGWAFHLGLGWNGYWDFSSVGAAYYAAFLPVGRVEGLARPRAAGWVRAGRAALGALALAIAGALIWDAATPGSPQAWMRGSHAAGRWVWLALWLAAGAVLARAAVNRLRSGSALADARGRAAWPPAQWIAPVLVAVNGLTPYLGLKTEHAFAMFSNLRTEGVAWNHLLVPRAVRVFGYQDELVRVVRARPLALRRIAGTGVRVVPFELRRHAARHPDAPIAYARGGLVQEFPRAADDPFLAPDPWPLRKLLLFRAVPPPGRSRCLH